MIPRVRMVKFIEGWRDPLDVLYAQREQPLPDEEEVQLILSRLPPEETILNMTKQPDGDYAVTGLVVPRSRRRR